MARPTAISAGEAFAVNIMMWVRSVNGHATNVHAANGGRSGEIVAGNYVVRSAHKRGSRYGAKSVLSCRTQYPYWDHSGSRRSSSSRERGSSDPMVGQALKSRFLNIWQRPQILNHFPFSTILYHPFRFVSVLCCLFWTQIGHSRMRVERGESF